MTVKICQVYNYYVINNSTFNNIHHKSCHEVYNMLLTAVDSFHQKFSPLIIAYLFFQGAHQEPA